MAFWYQIRHSKIRFLSQQCKRWYSQIPRGGVSSAYCGGAGGTNIRVYEKPNLFICRRPTDPYYNTLRFFAAPVQTKPKPEAKDSSKTRLNHQIKADIVRLVGDEGHVVVALREALDRAKKLNLDLVEVDRNAKPPVCKIMDFHREKYEQKVKEKDRVKGKTEVTLRKGDIKEVRFKAKTEQKDLEIKANMAIRLMEKGYRVKCMAMGKEEEDLGGQLARLSTLLKDIAVVESGPRVEKKQAFIIVRHVKFGPLKKGPSKNISELMATRTELQIAATSSPTVETSSASEQAESPSKCSMKTTDGKPEKSNMVWSEFGKSDDFQEVFDFDSNKSDNAKGFVPTRSSERASFDPKAGHSSSVQQHNLNISHGAPGSVRVRPQFPNQGRQPQHNLNISQGAPGSERVRPQFPNQGRQPQHNLNISHGAPGSERVRPQFPNQGRQPQTPVYAASPSLEQKQVENDASTLRNLKQPSADNNTRKQEPYRPSTTPTPPPPPPPSSYGIFSAPKPTIPPSQQGRVRESNMEVKPLDSQRNPRSSRSHLNENPADIRQRPEADQPSQRAWGIFSRESSGANQNSSDGKTNRQR